MNTDILIAIKPRYSQQIMTGTKKVEYRKRIPTGIQYPFKMLIYESAPTMKVVGYAIVNSILNNTPEQLWNDTNHTGGIQKDAYDQYFSGCDTAYAFKIESVVTFDNPVHLSDIEVKRAPQSWQYIDKGLIEKVIELGMK